MDRNLRRQQKKNGGAHLGLGIQGQITAALDELKKVGDIGQVAESLPGLLTELVELRDELRGAVAHAEESGLAFEAELTKQRAVFMRFFWSRGSVEAEPSLSPGPDMLSKFLTLEERYRAEYDAMCVLVKLLSWAKEAS